MPSRCQNPISALYEVVNDLFIHRLDDLRKMCSCTCQINKHVAVKAIFFIKEQIINYPRVSLYNHFSIPTGILVK